MNTTDPQLQELATGFREALRHSVYLVRRLDADGELSAAQLSTLKMLLGEGQRVGEIARNLGVRVPSATEQIIKLERAGLARREPDPADSRAVRVILTPEGRAAVDSANRRRNQVMAEILSTLTDQDRKALAEALPVIDKINASLQK
ncbi:MarR family transcriptional regulator [Arthrobacter sp. ISL-85]|uniref:MarR family winged helix-turn-helix transcriptional regulator n=1 Tax=Arthrobacter sp. ISL-85 TaxID=2819115 RepID=UPI001BEBF1A8|nr:MarR family transcriptional regulator [Arthrobacter sp. ISL-85]MBT2567452.1 MarR family transcriptional regulator [Arthrobacter sp. ISL-85]